MLHQAWICSCDGLEIKSPLGFVDDLAFRWLRRRVNKRNSVAIMGRGLSVLSVLPLLYSSRHWHIHLWSVLWSLSWFCKVCYNTMMILHTHSVHHVHLAPTFTVNNLWTVWISGRLFFFLADAASLAFRKSWTNRLVSWEWVWGLGWDHPFLWHWIQELGLD